MDVPLSWRTDIAGLVASGSSVEEHADHLVVRTPTDPAYDWGNFVMVTDPETVDDAARWEAVFPGAFAGDELAADTAGSGRPSPAARHTGRRSAPDPFPRDPSRRFSHVPTAPGPRRAPARRTARLLGG